MNTTIENIEEIESPPAGELSPKTLPTVLRYIGATTLGLSALSFAVQRVGELDSIGRFYSFLGFTAVLAACGFLCGLKIKEDKGARTFLGISLVFLPALFLQLGGLVYFLVNGVPPHIPQMFVVRAPDVTSVIMALTVCIPISALIAFGGFSALVRSHAKSLSALFAVGLAGLLVPTRVVDLVALMILALGIIDALYTATIGKRDPALRTFEGRTAQLIVGLPLALMIGRTSLLYGATALFGAATCVIIATFLWTIGEKTVTGKASMTQMGGLAMYAAGWAYICKALISDPAGLLYFGAIAGAREAMYVPMIFLPISIGLAYIAPALGSDRKRAQTLASAIAALPMAYQVVGVDYLGVAAAGLLIGATIISAAFLTRDRTMLINGGILVGSVLLVNIHYVFDLYRYNPWLTLGITGGVILLGSSYLERNLAAIVAQFDRARHELGNWGEEAQS